MYDVSSEKSFLNLRNWITSIRENTNNSKIKIVIIGNKIDLIENGSLKNVPTNEAEALAKVNCIKDF